MNSAAPNSSLVNLLGRWLVLALGVTLATKIVPGIRCDDGVTLVAVVLLLTILNAILKPILVLFTLPLILVSMGLGMIVINALLLLLVGRLVEGFEVSGFGAAAYGAIIISLTTFVAGLFTRRPRQPPAPPPPAAPRRGPPPGKDDVIDI